jgi:hypothetical protein
MTGKDSETMIENNIASRCNKILNSNEILKDFRYCIRNI